VNNAHLYATDPFADEICGCHRFGPTHIRGAKEKLTIQVRNVDGVHVNDIQTTKAHQGQVLQ